MNRSFGTLLGLLLCATGLCAQSNVPVLSGAVAFVSTTNAGATFYQPILAPVLAMPLGDHWLVESRGDIQGLFIRQNGTSGPYDGQFITSLDYLQLDYIANSHLTVSVGRFLTPFNIYNERFSALWIRNLQDPAVIYTIGTRTSGSSNGAMVRGVAASGNGWNLNYAAYFSSLTTTDNLESGRAAGGRLGVFLPDAGVEIGASYQRVMQDGDYNAQGTYFAWLPPQVPVDVRAEYAHSPAGQGYWLEGAVRLAKSRSSIAGLGRVQAVARMQQFFAGNPIPEALLPGVDVKRFDFGLNYYLPHDVRLNGSYGRQFSSAGNANIWNVQITYRFLFPAWPGEHR
jgi:hypothetical protein